MKNWRRISVPFLLVLFFSLAAQASAVTLSGVVRDDAGTALSGIEVMIFDPSSGDWIVSSNDTDATGSYVIPSLGPGTYNIGLYVLSSGPGGHYSIIDINPIIANLDVTTDTEQDITLPPLATVSGYTKDSNGIAVGNVRIYTQSCWTDSSPGFESGRCSGSNVYSDQDGAYSFTVLPGGAYSINLTPPVNSGFAELAVYDFQINGNMAHDFVLPQGFSVSGLVRDDSGSPLVDAEVYIYDAADGNFIDIAYPDATGNYSIITLVSGTYNISVNMWKDIPVALPFSSNYWFGIEPFMVNLDLSENTVQDITIPLATVSGYTKDSNGNAVANVRITADSCWNDSSSGFVSEHCSGAVVYSDQNGAYSITLLAEGAYTIEITPPGGKGLAELVENNFQVNGDMSHDFVLPQGFTVSGLVVPDDAGIPLGDVEVIIIAPSSGEMLHSTYADDSGNYSISLIPGTYDIRVKVWNSINSDSWGYYSYDINPIISNLDVTTDTEQDITLPPLATVSGYTKDSNGIAVGNVTIYAQSCWTDSSPGFESGRCSIAEINSDQDGAYSFIVLSGGAYLIEITPPAGSGFMPSVVNDFPINENMTHDFILSYIMAGDINVDGAVDVADAIVAMQVLAGISPLNSAIFIADVNGDGKISFAEALYALQVAAGVRALDSGAAD